MSRFSGKCDLYDSMIMSASNEHRIVNPGGSWGVTSDLDAFEDFKTQTDGVIYQHLKVEVTEFNAEPLTKLNSNFHIIEHTSKVKDKRCKSGEREIKTYTYKIGNTEYATLKELNKAGGLWIEVPIKFDNILELVPYFPYVSKVEFGYTDAQGQRKQKIVLSDNSYVDMHSKKLLQGLGIVNDTAHYYRHELSEYYKDIILKLFRK